MLVKILVLALILCVSYLVLRTAIVSALPSLLFFAFTIVSSCLVIVVMTMTLDTFA